MNHSSQLWLNRSRSLITIPPDNSPRSLTFSTRINRLIRYQRIIISLSNYLISSNKYFIGQQYSSQFRIERKLHAKSSFVEKFRTFEYCSLFFFFFLLHEIFADRSSVKGFGEQCRNAIKCASLIERYSSSFRNVVFREMTLGKNRCWPPHLHTFVGHDTVQGGGTTLSFAYCIRRCILTCASVVAREECYLSKVLYIRYMCVQRLNYRV